MPSFDIVSRVNMAEVDNAIAGAVREIQQRYDFKGSASQITREDETIILLADDDSKLKQLQELLRGYMARRGVEVSALDFDKTEPASGQMVRQKVKIKQGINRELGKDLVKAIKDSKLKVQIAIQGDELRVSGKKRDDLQEAISLLKKLQVVQPLQYQNFRD